MAMNVNPIVAGVFQNESQAREALQGLRAAGFRVDQIGYATQAQSQGVNLLDDLQNLGLARNNATYYDREFRAGRPVVSVRADGREQEAEDILHQYGGYDYEHQSGIAQSNVAATQTTTANRAAVGTANVGQAAVDERDEFYQPRRLQLRAEQLDVTKNRVQAGEVGLRKEVVTEQQTIDVPVTHEEVYIERRPVTGGQVDTTPIGEDETIRVPVSEEQVNVTKNTVVTGEVAIGKREVTENQRVSDTVRREEARVEQSGDARVLENRDAANRTVDDRTVDNRDLRDRTDDDRLR
jgi:uncharacterized protein (TIGR02271 family)